MTDAQIADALYEHRLTKSVMKTRDWTFFCTCFGWSTSTTVTHGHAHQEWIHHIADVLNSAFVITARPPAAEEEQA